jgi:hypothetical protein
LPEIDTVPASACAGTKPFIATKHHDHGKLKDLRDGEEEESGGC